MNNLDGFVIGTLEQIAVSIPEEELRKRFETLGFPKEQADYIMDCINNSKKKYQKKRHPKSKPRIDHISF